MQVSNKVGLGHGPYGAAVVCIEDIQPGEVLFRLTGKQTVSPHKYTAQLDRDLHVDPGEELWAMANHACQPNCFLDFSLHQMVALTPIKPNEEITFNYLSSEWELAAPFDCGCEATHCPGTIRGFRYLDDPQREAIRDLLSPFLIRQLHREKHDDQGDALHTTHGTAN